MSGKVDLQFPAQQGIGEYKKGCHWKDLPLAEKVMQATKAVFKVLSCAALVGACVFFAIPAAFALAIAAAVATLVALVGLLLLAYSFYRIYHVDQHSPIPFPAHVPGLGVWSENSVFMTENGEESMQMKLRLVESAQHSIEISGSYCGGKIFDTMLDLIAQKLESNPELQVKIIANQDLLTTSNYERIRLLAQRYPNNFFLLETKQQFILLPTLRTIANHTKFLIADGTRGMTGGTGVQDMLSREGAEEGVELSAKEKFLGKGARDMDALVTGPIAETMRHEYYQLLEKWNALTPQRRKYGNLEGQREFAPVPEQIKDESIALDAQIFQDKNPERVARAPTTLITGGYEHGSAHGCFLAYMQMIREAQKTISIANMCLNYPPIVTELENAARRGVKIRVITNGNDPKSPMGARFLGPANRSELEKLLQIGVVCYEYAQESTLFHKKVMIIDDRYTTIGSYNLSYHCSESEDEDILIFDSEEVAEQTQAILDEDVRRSQQISPATTTGYYFNELLKRIALLTTAHIFQ
jgi:phosphatidylserine/phosphatidylglycerophosphate/cardiolipin synthase-like enzyme